MCREASVGHGSCQPRDATARGRATRDRPVWAALVSACLTHDVKIAVGGKLHDPHDPDDGFMLDLGAALAVRESAMNSKRICRDVAARAAQGLPHGKIPYGYRRVYDSRTRALIRQEPDPETAPIVQELARRVLAGEAFYAITHELNTRGVPSPETIRMRRLGNTTAWWPWRQDQVRNVVLSPTSAGRRVHRGVVIAGVTASWQPLISASDHALLIERLCDPNRRSWKDGGVKHLLTFLARCGVCGAPVRRIVNRDKYANYSCSGGPGKFCIARKQQWVDTYVTDVIIERLSQPDALEVYAPDSTGLQEVRQSLVALEAELATLRAAKKDGRISLQAFLDFEPDLLTKIEQARARLLLTTAPPVLVDLAGAHVRQRWERLTIPQRREVIRTLCIVKINPTRQGARRLDPSTIIINWKSTQLEVPGGISGRRYR